MTGGSHIHPDKYLGVAWADRPPPQSGLSARQVLQWPRYGWGKRRHGIQKWRQGG